MQPITPETCDKCGPTAVAVVTVFTPNGLPLSFCAHHFREYKSVLCEYSAVFNDELWCDTHDSAHPCPHDAKPDTSMFENGANR